MIELGKKQVLKVARKKQFGVYLYDGADESQAVLLPVKYVPENCEEGDEIEVFVYRDSQDRLISTTKEPKVMLGETAYLEVKEEGNIGLFLDWGLEKDLFLPFKEQTYRPKPGQCCLVALYIDKSSRLCATMRVYEYLRCDGEYTKDQMVDGVVYQINERLGAFVAVDHKYHGLIPKRECHCEYKPGDQIKARVVNIREDGKLELTLNDKIAVQIDRDADKVLRLLQSYDGVLPFTEKASPEVVERELGMSKAAFKRAIGHLLKQGAVSIEDGKIKSAF